MNQEYSIRPATAGDAGIIAHHRARMFFDMGRLSEKEIEALVTASKVYFEEALGKKEYIGWLVEHDKKIVAGGGLVLRQAPPFPGNLKITESAYIFNMYTEHAYRRRGLARMLMNAMLDWCRARSVSSVSLHASGDGRALYEHLGFEPANEMRLKG